MALQYGRVTGRLTWPDGRAIPSRVAFIARPRRLISADDDVIVFPRTVTARLDLDGNLVGDDGELGVSLIANNSPGYQPEGWTWSARIEADGRPLWTFDFEVTAGSEQDLAEVSPVEPDGGSSPGSGPGVESYDEISGLADYPSTFPPDLTNVTPGSIGAQPAGDYLTEEDLPTPLDLSGYATKAELFSGSYEDLDDKPTIPSTPQDIGAQPAGSYATTSAIADMVAGDGITNIVALTQNEYDQLTPNPTTLYVITDT